MDQAENRNSKKLIPIVLIILILLFGLWFALVNSKDDTSSSQSANGAPAATQELADDIQSSGALSTLDAITDVSDKASLTGREVTLTNVPVYTVIGDRSFTVGTADKYAFVLLDTGLDTGGAEQAVAVKEGESRNITGKIEAVPADTAQIAESFDFSEEQIAQLKAQGYFIRATETNVGQ